MRPEAAGSTAGTEPGYLPEGGNALIVGASRGIGLAFVEHLLRDRTAGRIYAACRTPDDADQLRRLAADDDRVAVLMADVTDEASLVDAAARIGDERGRLDLLINCAGLLHEAPRVWPERQLSDVDAEALEKAFRTNAIGPLLVMKAFEGLLKRSAEARVATLSARVGSIGDNRLGGWYAYRGSKAALNQLVRTTAIQWSRLPRPILCVVLHPGTVRTDLSAPFTRPSYQGRVFDAQEAAGQLLTVLGGLQAEDSGNFFAWDGQRIPW